MPRPPRLLCTVGAAMISATLLSGCASLAAREAAAGPATRSTPDPTSSTPAVPGPVVDTALAALATLPVKGRAPMTGYSREPFGPAWLDANRNGCDERNDILARDLHRRRPRRTAASSPGRWPTRTRPGTSPTSTATGPWSTSTTSSRSATRGSAARGAGTSASAPRSRPTR